MKRRIFNVMAVVSLALCAATVVVWAFSYSWNIQLSHNQITAKGSELTLAVAPFDGQIRFIRQRWQFTPLGAQGERLFSPGFHAIFDSRQSPGSVSRGFEYIKTKSPGLESAYLGVPLWFLTFLFGLLPTVHVWKQRQRRATLLRRERGLCPSCGYDLRATPDRCPECGAAVLADRQNEFLATDKHSAKP